MNVIPSLKKTEKPLVEVFAYLYFKNERILKTKCGYAWKFIIIFFFECALSCFGNSFAAYSICLHRYLTITLSYIHLLYEINITLFMDDAHFVSRLSRFEILLT